jgi:hypothetical protein
MLSIHKGPLLALFLSSTAWCHPLVRPGPVDNSILHGRNLPIMSGNEISKTLQVSKKERGLPSDELIQEETSTNPVFCYHDHLL